MRLAIGTIVYWFLAFWVVALLLQITVGDCGVEETQVGLEECLAEQRQALGVLAALSLAFYGFLVWQSVKYR